VISQLFLIGIGDSIEVDSKDKKISLYQNNILKKEWDFYLPSNTTFFFSFVKKEHHL